jgi:hypothetical protein
VRDRWKRFGEWKLLDADARRLEDLRLSLLCNRHAPQWASKIDIAQVVRNTRKTRLAWEMDDD